MGSMKKLSNAPFKTNKKRAYLALGGGEEKKSCHD